MRSASSWLGSEEMPTNDMTGAILRYVKYSVGLRPQVISDDSTPRALSRRISASTARCCTMLKPPARPLSDATRMNSTCLSSVRWASSGCSVVKPDSATLASMRVMASL